MKRLIMLLLTAALLLSGCYGGDNQLHQDPTVVTSVPTNTSNPITTSTPPVTPPDPIRILLDSMTLAQKVGQLFICEAEQLQSGKGAVTSVTDELRTNLAKYPVGGIILFAENVISPEQLLTLNQQLQAASDLPLFIATDEEGGRVTRLGKNKAFGLKQYKSAAAVGASGDPADALEMGRTIGAYLKEYGLNLDFAPVADVNTNPKNPIIGNRAFSSDPVIAGKMAEAFAQGLSETGVAATFKHFPGHGDTAEDSHMGLAVNYKTKEELVACEWIPFMKADSADMVMVGHIALPNVTGDMTPATMSYEIVTEILKKELKFSGLVITDALDMGAITQSYTSAEAAVAALQAGCDILLMSEDVEEAFDAVMDAVEDGTLSMEWLEETVYRILQFKQEHEILKI